MSAYLISLCSVLVLLGLDAQPEHVLPLRHIGVLLDKLVVAGQQELPAAVDPGDCHLLQEVLHVLWGQLVGAFHFKSVTQITLS